MTNVIVDAGTDAKIAKFQKRGIELIDLALLEPVEVWGEGGREREAKKESMKIVADEMGASVVVNAGGARAGNPSPKSHTSFLQPEKPAAPSAKSSAASLYSQMANSATQTPIAQHLASHPDLHTPAASDILPISQSNSDTILSNNLTPMPPVSPPASLTSMSIAMMSPPASPAPMPKRKLFNKLFHKRQNSSSLLSPSGSIFPGSPGVQQSFAQSESQPTTTTGFHPQDLEVSPSPMSPSFTLSPAPLTSKITGTADWSFGGRSNSMKRRSAAPPALTEPLPASPIPNSGVGDPSMSPPIEQQKTPTQSSVAAGGAKTKPKTNTASSPPTPTPYVVEVREREAEKVQGRGVSLASLASPFRSTLKNRLSSAVMGGGVGSQPSSQVRDSGPSIDKLPTPTIMKESDRDSSPHPSLGSFDKSRSRSSLVFTTSTNESADSHGGVGYGGIGQVTPAQAEIMMNLRQQQLQLRPPVLGIQPTFVSSSPSASSNGNPSNPLSPDGSSTTTTENTDQLFGQRALMYVWLVRRWMKKRSTTLGGLSGLGDSAVGFLGEVVGGLKSEKERDKRKKDKDKRRNSEDIRPGSSHAGLAAVTAPLMYGGVEVRFEWKRARARERGGSGKKKTRNGRGRTGTEVGRAESDGEIEANKERDDRDERGSIRGGAPVSKTKERLKSEEKKKYRMSTGSIGSITSSSGMDGGEFETKKRNQYDDGEDSDPEDSETPWICTLKLRRGATPAAGGGDPTAGDTQPQPAVLQTRVLRIKVGTVSPTPHHPKVVAMLKVPFPLPDIEVERMGVIKRQGVIPPQNSTYNGLVLTAEEIKDVVCSTGLWLVVREGFGGVGRVSRKGDGWRIRP